MKNKVSNYNHIFKLNPQIYTHHQQWMKYAIKLAQKAGEDGEVPVGAVIINDQGKLIAQAQNCKQAHQNATSHAEILAIGLASKKLQRVYLNNCTLYVTLEPCPMCTGAILHARIGLLVYGADDPKTGTIRTVMNIPDSPCSNHSLKVLGGIMGKACSEQLKRWFKQHRK